jgi:hypothetical protein
MSVWAPSVRGHGICQRASPSTLSPSSKMCNSPPVCMPSTSHMLSESTAAPGSGGFGGGFGSGSGGDGAVTAAGGAVLA